METVTKEKSNYAKPFLRWAGGKQWLGEKIIDYLPSTFNNYHEPFVGGGAVFFTLFSHKLIKKAYLNDLNTELINCYIQVKNNYVKIESLLKQHKNEKNFYYEMRAQLPVCKVERASKFLLLNRTSFNGIYRVNRQGQYNVPYGYKNYSQLYDFENLKAASKSLKYAYFTKKDFATTIGLIKEGDLVFIDPPYTIAHENNGFVEYNEKIFGWSDQVRLAEYINAIISKKAYFIMTNACHESIKHLFKRFGRPKKIERHSVIGGSNARRGLINEFLFTNC